MPRKKLVYTLRMGRVLTAAFGVVVVMLGDGITNGLVVWDENGSWVLQIFDVDSVVIIRHLF